MMLTPNHVMLLSLVLFGIGIFGVLTRRNILIVLMSLELVLNAANIPADELLIANLQRASLARPPETRRQFLLAAGRELARLLSHDLVRLESILRRIRPV